MRYSSDLTDDERAYAGPLIPPAERGGNKRRVDVRDVMNGIMDISSTGCQWWAIPKDPPARSTLFDDLDLLSWNFVDMLQKTDLDGFLLTKPTRIVPP